MKTDSQLQQAVIAELEWEPAVHAARIGVEVKDNVVTLAGQTDSYAEKWRAEKLALGVPGVRAMASELKVHLPGPSQRSDGDIAGAAENVLDWTSSLPAGAIQVMVEGGWVTLSGDVDWQYQKQAAADSVCRLMGVIGVNDQISVKPVAQLQARQADIKAALRRAAIVDADQITVDVHGGDVTLGGSIRNWAERETAKNSTWGAPGVRSVVDLMTLA